MTQKSSLHRKLKELPGDWRLSHAIFKSPATKSLAIIPIFGYFLLLNSEFRSWLSVSEFERYVGTDPLATLKQVYYGGWCILAAMYIHYFYCPGIVKGAPSLEEFEHNFRSTGTVTDVVSMIFQAARQSAIFGDQSQKSIAFAEQASLLLDRLRSFPRSQVLSSSDIDRVIDGVTNSPLLAENDYLEMSAFENSVYWNAAKHSDDALVRHYAQSLANGFYVENAKLPVIWRTISNGLAIIGALMIFSPAVLSFSRILLSDLGWLN